MKYVLPTLVFEALFVLLITGQPLPEGPAVEASPDITDAVKQVSAESPDTAVAGAEAAAAVDAAAAASDGAAAPPVPPVGADAASVAAAEASAAQVPQAVAPAAGALPHLTGTISGPAYEHESHQHAAQQNAFKEAAQGAQQSSQAADSGNAFKKNEGFENQSGFRKQDGFSENSSNRYGTGFFQGSEGQHEFNRGDQHSFGVSGYGVHSGPVGVVGRPTYHELLKVGFVP